MVKSRPGLAIALALIAIAFGAGSAHAQVAADPVELIVAIYETYLADNNSPGLPDVYSRRLQGLLDANKRTRRPAKSESRLGRVHRRQRLGTQRCRDCARHAVRQTRPGAGAF